jgi:hypothetical protein
LEELSDVQNGPTGGEARSWHALRRTVKHKTAILRFVPNEENHLTAFLDQMPFSGLFIVGTPSVRGAQFVTTPLGNSQAGPFTDNCGIASSEGSLQLRIVTQSYKGRICVVQLHNHTLHVQLHWDSDYTCIRMKASEDYSIH